MRIKFKNYFSNHFSLGAGVPQGSVLAPTLFILYTNDLPDPVHPLSLTIQYADDVTQLISAPTYNTLARLAQQELDRVTEWEHKWRIQANKNKSHTTYFPHTIRHTPLQLDSFTQPPHQIPTTRTNRVLGLNYDSALHIHRHIEQKVAIAQTNLRQLYRFRYASHKTKLHLYKTLVLPHLTYSPLTLTLAYPTNRRKLQIVQNKALRLIYNIHWTQYRTNKSLHEEARLPPLNIRWRHMIDIQLTNMTFNLPYWDQFLQDLTDGRDINLFSVVDTPYPDDQY